MADESKGRRRRQPESQPADTGRAADKDETRAADTAGEVSPESATPAPPGGDQGRAKQVQQAPGQYLVTARAGGDLAPMGLMPFSFDTVNNALEQDEEVNVKRVLKPAGVLGALATGLPGQPSGVVVAEMSNERASTLSAMPQLVVEEDHPVGYTLVTPSTVSVPDPGVVTPFGDAFPVTLTVTGQGGAPLEGASVYVYGSIWPAQGTTDASGTVRLTLHGETPGSLKGLYVNPRAGHWNLWLERPMLEPGQSYRIALRPLPETLPGFPGRQVLGWGQRAMRLDQIPTSLRGQGIKVAVIDSGAATTHSDLQQIRLGRDTTGPDQLGWTQDVIAHGSHCVGVISGQDNPTGIRGFAPDAEVHVCKIFPGGRFSNLIDALDYCIEHQIDVANLSLGSDEYSDLLEKKIRQALELGIALVVAAGNASGPVKYPATSPNVLAVSAVGRLGEFPADSYHATQVLGSPTPDGWFAAKFSCFGPQIKVCAPGVAVLSSVPPDGYAAWDGTSMAAPHVTGLAALVLAHHPDFQGPYRRRNANRVARLFQILMESAVPLPLGDPARTGVGMPDAVRALAPVLQAGVSPATVAMPGLPPDVLASLQRLQSALATGDGDGMGQPGAVTPMGGAVGGVGSTQVGQAIGDLLTALQRTGGR